MVDALCKEAGALTSWQSLEVDAEGHELLAAEGMKVTLSARRGRGGAPVPAPRRSGWSPRPASGCSSRPWSRPLADLLDACRGRLLMLDRLAAVVAQRAGRAIEVRAKTSDAAGKRSAT